MPKILVCFISLISIQIICAAPTQLVDEAPVSIEQLADGTHLVDFGRVAFGNVILHPPSGARGELRLHFGEAMKNERVDRKPPGTVPINKRLGHLMAALRYASPLLKMGATHASITLRPRQLF